MKKNKLYILGLLLILVTPAFSQLKVHSNGNVGIGSYYPDFGADLNLQTYNGPSLKVQTDYSTDWKQAIISIVNRPLSVTYVVRRDNLDRFYITGNGTTHTTNKYMEIPGFSNEKSTKEVINSPIKILGELKAFKYNSIYDNLDENKTEKLRIGLDVNKVAEVLPEVVEEIKGGELAISYSSMVPLLIEAINAQQKQIEELQSKLNDNSSSVGVNNSIISSESKLYQNNPNPFSQETEIKFSIDEKSSNAQVIIFNFQGHQIKSYPINKEDTQIKIDGEQLTAGIYYYALIVDGVEIDTKKMILTK